jgi:hypothetical protein
MVVACIALFVALGGSAVALNGQNTVQSDDLGPGAQVKAADVANNAVSGPDIVDNSVTGADVRESTLQGVNAATVSGGKVCRGTTILTNAAHSDVSRIICTSGPLSIRARCISFPSLTEARYSLENSADHSFYAFAGGQENSDWANAQADPFLAVVDASDPAGDVGRETFSAGGANGSQLAGESAVRVRELGGTTVTAGACNFTLAAVG